MLPALPLLLACATHEQPVEQPAPPEPPERGYLTISAGESFALEGEDLFELGAEWRFPAWKWRVAPLVGGTWFEGGDTFVYAGLRWEIPIAGDVYVAPGFAAGLYEEEVFDLGNAVEFRSSVELGWQVRESLRFGLTFAHLSNSHLSGDNPGRESLALTVALRPFEWFE